MGTQTHPLIYLLSMDAFTLQGQIWVKLQQRAYGLQNLKYLLPGPCQALVKVNSSPISQPPLAGRKMLNYIQ